MSNKELKDIKQELKASEEEAFEVLMKKPEVVLFLSMIPAPEGPPGILRTLLRMFYSEGVEEGTHQIMVTLTKKFLEFPEEPDKRPN